MKLDIRFRGFTPAVAIKDKVKDRVKFHLERFEQRLTGVLVRVADVNGPKGGPDKRCQVTVHAGSAGTSTIVTTGATSEVAVDDALTRVAEALHRKADKAQTKRVRSPRAAMRRIARALNPNRGET
jgi:putative sigma-54 modulation protein